MREVSGMLVPTGKGTVYFIVTGTAISVPLVWLLLVNINRRSRDFNLHDQRQLQINLRRERLEKALQPQPTDTGGAQ